MKEIINSKILIETVNNIDEKQFILEEGLLGDLKDRIVNKVKDYASYNDWCREVQKILMSKYRLAVSELKGIFDAKVFKNCYKLGAKPINFVKVLMKKYLDYMTPKQEEPEDDVEYYEVTPMNKYAFESKGINMKLAEAKNILKENNIKFLMESNAEIDNWIELVVDKLVEEQGMPEEDAYEECELVRDFIKYAAQKPLTDEQKVDMIIDAIFDRRVDERHNNVAEALGKAIKSLQDLYQALDDACSDDDAMEVSRMLDRLKKM